MSQNPVAYLVKEGVGDICKKRHYQNRKGHDAPLNPHEKNQDKENVPEGIVLGQKAEDYAPGKGMRYFCRRRI